jgi:hypothetical protein
MPSKLRIHFDQSHGLATLAVSAQFKAIDIDPF